MWILLMLGVVTLQSANDIIKKYLLNRKYNEYALAFGVRSIAGIIALSIAFFQPVSLDVTFWIALACGGTLNTVTTVLYFKALKYTDISIAMPLLALTPAFLLVTSPLIAGEIPPAVGMVGVLFIVAGAYALLYTPSTGLLAPFAAIRKNKGVRYMLIVAILYSITSAIDKVGVQHSSPILWAGSVNVWISLLLAPICVHVLQIKKVAVADFVKFAPLGVMAAATSIMQMLAISLIYVSYVASMKRLTILVAVVVGGALFQEGQRMQRSIAALIMVAGVVIIALS